MRKCVKEGKLQNTENLPFTSGRQIPVLGEEGHHKFLGKLQNFNQLDKQVFQKASHEYLRRLAAMDFPTLHAKKSKGHKHVCLPSSAILYVTVCSSEWAIEDLPELDWKTWSVIAQNKGKHNSESNPTLYLSPDLGGRGLKETEIQYKVTKIKTAHYTTTSKDPDIEVVRTFQGVKETNKSRSVIKDAKTYAQQLNVNVHSANNTNSPQ